MAHFAGMGSLKEADLIGARSMVNFPIINSWNWGSDWLVAEEGEHGVIHYQSLPNVLN